MKEKIKAGAIVVLALAALVFAVAYSLPRSAPEVQWVPVECWKELGLGPVDMTPIISEEDLTAENFDPFAYLRPHHRCLSFNTVTGEYRTHGLFLDDNYNEQLVHEDF